MISWFNYAAAFEAIHAKLQDILTQLSICDSFEVLSSAKRAPGIGVSNIIDLSLYKEALAIAKVTDSEGINPTLDIKFQTSDNIIDWADLGDEFAQIVGAGVYLKKLTSNFGKHVRAVWTLGGVVPSIPPSIPPFEPAFTFSLVIVAKH